MTILKLPKEGDTYTGHVVECKETPSRYGVQVAFKFANNDLLYLPATSAVRQLLRAGFDDGGDPPKPSYEAVEGNTLCFTRDHNPNSPEKPYWGIRLADAFDKAETTKPASKRLAGPDAVPGTPPRAAQEALRREQGRPDAPPAHHQESGLPTEPDFLDVPSEGQPRIGQEDGVFADYFETMDNVAARMVGIAKTYDVVPPEFSAIQAATFSVYGLIRSSARLPRG